MLRRHWRHIALTATASCSIVPANMVHAAPLLVQTVWRHCCRSSKAAPSASQRRRCTARVLARIGRGLLTQPHASCHDCKCAKPRSCHLLVSCCAVSLSPCRSSWSSGGGATWSGRGITAERISLLAACIAVPAMTWGCLHVLNQAVQLTQTRSCRCTAWLMQTRT